MENKHPNKKFMKIAIATALKGFKNNQYPIGAVVVVENKVLASSYTTLNITGDPSCHAEVNAIRLASKKINTNKKINTGSWAHNLENAWLYSTMESCTMCTSLTIWAGMKGMVYGTDSKTFFKANNMSKNNARYIFMHPYDIIKNSNPKLKLYKGFMEKECDKLLELYKK